MSGVPALDVTLELVADVAADIGEGPIWDDQTGTLIFVDSTIGRIYRLDPSSGALTSIDAGQEIGAAIPRRSGGLVASGRDGLLAVGDDGSIELLVPIEKDLDHRMNDAKCDARGRLWSGTFSMAFERGAGSLYRVGAGLEPNKMLGDVFVSNGMGWSPDDSIFYYVDTGARAIDAFDYDIETGEISNRRRFLDIPRPAGLPDGMAVDAEGCLWVALYLGGAVRRFSPEGVCLGAISLPMARVTSCNFGGPQLEELYITTANQLIHDDGRPHEPHAGATYRCRPGVRGLPSHRFAG
ncbi:SMP-30/gluconolactonase/LRE family protein [Sphingobium aquiterrae]|uniref:SMP-30/gluconolactonase/LRE family protein n=1 Tax=Sphingobium aquiterrae TaxID=2038656 RepID=UPI003019B940